MGMRGYKPDPRGFAEIGQAAAIQKHCMRAAEAGATWANLMDPAGKYEAIEADVPAGRKNELRAGAKVRQTEDSLDGARQRVLARTPAAIESR